MKYRIHFETKDGADSFIIEGQSIDEVRVKVDEFLNARGLFNADLNVDMWSEEIQ